MVFNYILNGNKRFSRLQKCQSNIVRKCPFFLRGCPLICIKNRSLNFFEKDLDIMFKYLLNNIKNFLDYKNVILTYSKHDHFSKAGNPGAMSIFPKRLNQDFSQNFEISSESHFL